MLKFYMQEGQSTRSEKNGKMNGVSFSLCIKIIEALEKNNRKFHVQTLFILNHNTQRDPDGNTSPIFSGFMVRMIMRSDYYAPSLCFLSFPFCCVCSGIIKFLELFLLI